MRLHITLTSPYARMVRIVIREKGLEDRVEEVVARTRTPGSPYYAINPSGRVPCLILPDGKAMEDSALICDYLDNLDGHPALARPRGADRWEFAVIEARARSTIDGLAVLIRERYRPENERSPGVIAHEVARAKRLLAIWDGAANDPVLTGPLNYIQMLIACIAEIADRAPELDVAAQWPRLSARAAEISRRPSFVATAPPVA